MNNIFKRTLSILLTAVMLVGFVPMAAKAEDGCVHDYTSSSTFLKDNGNIKCVEGDEGDNCHYCFCTECNKWIKMSCTNPICIISQCGTTGICVYCNADFTYHKDVEWVNQTGDGNCYWHCKSCNEDGTPHDHYYGEKIEVGGVTYGCDCGIVCLKCGNVRSDAQHCFEIVADDCEHWYVCTDCGIASERECHSGGTATCTQKAVCEVCGTEYGCFSDHEIAEGVYQYDDNNHWQACKNCSKLYQASAHTYGEWHEAKTTGYQSRECTVCGYEETREYVEYEVTFDTLGRGTAVKSQTVIWGNCAEKPDNPTATGYEFVGWYKDQNCIYEFDFTAPIEEDTVIYAKWKNAEYDIIYREKDGSLFNGNHAEGYPKTHTYGKSTTLSTASEDGYVFEGWYTSQNFKESQLVTVLGATDYTSDINLYAKLTGNTFYVKYNGNGADAGTMENSEHVYGTASTLSKNQFSRTGYKFDGWTDGSGNVYDDGDDATYLSQKAGDTVNLYAKWTPRVYEIKYYDLGGAEFTGNIEDIPTTHTYDTKTELVDGYKAGYKFIGWYKDADCTEDPVYEIGAKELGEVVLYAKWEARQNQICYLPNGDGVSGSMDNQAFTSGDEVTLSENQYKRTSYSFLGWSKTEGEENTAEYTDKQSGVKFLSDYTINLYAVWGKNYNVNLVTNGGTIADGKNVTSYAHKTATNLPTEADVTKPEYTFAGWYESADFSGDAVTVIPATATGDKTYYAKWVETTYYVTFTLASSTTTGGTATVSVDGFSSPVSTYGLGWMDLRGSEEIKVTASPDSSYYAKIYTDQKALAISSKGMAVTYQLTADDIKANSVIKIAFSTNPYTDYVVAMGNFGENDSLSWKLKGDGELAISGMGAIPDYDSAEAVPWNSYKKQITGIVIEDGITRIGNNAFYNYGELTNITISDSVLSVGEGAFSYCTALTVLVIESSDTVFESNAFYGCCYSIQSLTLPVTCDAAKLFPDGLVYLTSLNLTGNGDMPDYSRDNLPPWAEGYLEEVTFSDGITSIGDYAFYECASLSSISIPQMVDKIGSYAFYECTGLTDALILYEGLDEIDDFSFYGCSGIKGIVLPYTLKSIGNYSFALMNSVKGRLSIPSGTETIGIGAFKDDILLTSVNIPDSVNKIENWTFSGCSGLTRVEIGDGVAAIGDYAFLDCSKLTDVYYNKSKAEWNEISIGSNNECLINANIHYGEYIQYVIKYYSGDELLETQTKDGGTATFISSTIPTCDGYYFLGWAESADASEAKYQPGDRYTDDADVTLYAVWVPGPADAALTVSSGRMASDGRIEVSVTLSENSAAAAMQFKLAYDSTRLKLESCAAGEGMQESPTVNTNVLGEIYFAWDDVAPYQSGDPLLNLVFSAVDGASGSTELVIDTSPKELVFYGTDLNRLNVDTEGGTVEIIPYFTGDVNMDGDINILDCSLIRRYAAGLHELSDTQKVLADVNGDGKINVIDVNLVRRYVVKLITSFTNG